VKQKVPLDPPLSGRVNWDALSDSLWHGLAAQPQRHVAICWLDAHLFLHRDPAGFHIAVEVFQDVALMLREETRLRGTALPTLLVLLFGAGLPLPKRLVYNDESKWCYCAGRSSGKGRNGCYMVSVHELTPFVRAYQLSPITSPGDWPRSCVTAPAIPVSARRDPLRVGMRA
jgi:hypothetical protein